MPLDDAPERLLDHNLRRTIMLERLSDRTARRLARLIDAVVTDIVAQLRDADDLTAAARLRLEALIIQFAALHRQLAERLSVELDTVLRELTGREIESQLALLRRADIAVSTQLITSAQVYAAAMAEPIRGKFLRDWTASLSEAAQQRLSTALRIGFAEGESLAQIIKRVRGTAAANFTDGLTEIARRDLQTIVRTAMTHFSARAQRAVYERSPDLLDGYQWISVLDGRTCFRADTPVLTPSGERPINAIMPGDEVIGRDGKPQTVTATRQAQTRRITKVTLSDGRAVYCTPDHLWLTADGRWVEAGDLTKGDALEGLI